MGVVVDIVELRKRNRDKMRAYRAQKRTADHPQLVAKRQMKRAEDRVRVLTATEAAYLAGILDSDGGIYAQFKKNRPSDNTRYAAASVYAVNTDIRMLEWIVEKTGVGSTLKMTIKPDPTHMGRKPVYRWDVGSRLAAVIIKQVRDYMVLKQEQADLLIELVELKSHGNRWRGVKDPERHIAIVNRIQELNRRTGKTGARVLISEQGPVRLMGSGC